MFGRPEVFEDPTWNNFPNNVLISLEQFFVIVCGSIPAAKPMYDYIVRGKPLVPGKYRGPSQHSRWHCVRHCDGDPTERRKVPIGQQLPDLETNGSSRVNLAIARI